MKIGYCGASHLGLCYSAVSAQKGFEIVCFDFEVKKIKEFKNYQINIEEPKLKNILVKYKKSYIFTDKIKDLYNCDLVFYSYDIETNNKGESNNLITINNLKLLIKSIKKNIPLIILSQVNPGFTRDISKIRRNIYYQVETLVFGNAIERALKPERFIIGCKNSNSKLPRLFKSFLNSFNCPILIMKYESAELSKLAINCYLASSVTLTNTLAEISKNIGASWNEIIPTLQLDKRIGKNAYLKPGLGISGGNIERDLYNIANIGNKKLINTDFIKVMLKRSKNNKNWLYNNVLNSVTSQKYSRISLLGLSYKENTNSIKNSPAIELINKLQNATIKVYDPMVKNIKIKNVIECSSAYKTIANCQILIIATPWEEFSTLNLNKIKSIMKGSAIIDPFRLLEKNKVEKLGFNYYFL